MQLNPSEISDLIGPGCSNRSINHANIQVEEKGKWYIPPRITQWLPPLKINETSAIIQAMMLSWPENHVWIQAQLNRIYHWVAVVIPYIIEHRWSGKWVIGCSCGWMEGCPYNESPLIG
jgi:hypothetical protein